MADQLGDFVDTVENAYEKFFDTNSTCPDEATAEANSKVFWDVVFSMIAFFVLCVGFPYIFFCCKNYPRFLARFYGLFGMFNFIVGAILMSPVLLPKCPLECGDICKAHKYNPGPIYGCLCLFLSLIWWCKACFLRRQAKKMDIEKEAAKAEGANGARDGTRDVV